MSDITHGDAVRNDFVQAVLDFIDGGGGPGTCVFRSGSTDLCEVTLALPSFAIAAHVLNLFQPPGPGTVTITGITDNFEFRSSLGGATVAFGGSVTGTGGGGDMEISNTNLVINDQVTITAFDYQASP